MKKGINMIAEVSILSPAQLSILDMMSFVKTPTAIDELKSVLSDYFANRLSEEIDKMWENGDLSEAKIESFRHLHERTHYNNVNS